MHCNLRPPDARRSFPASITTPITRLKLVNLSTAARREVESKLELMTTSELRCLSGSKREDYQNCSVLYCALKLCTVISTLEWVVLTVLWIGLCHTASISLCVDLFVFICVYFVCFCFILHSCCIIVSIVGSTWRDWTIIFRTYPPSVLWHCWYLTRKNPSPIYDLCVWWDVKPRSIYLSVDYDGVRTLSASDGSVS